MVHMDQFSKAAKIFARTGPASLPLSPPRRHRKPRRPSPLIRVAESQNWRCAMAAHLQRCLVELESCDLHAFLFYPYTYDDIVVCCPACAAMNPRGLKRVVRRGNSLFYCGDDGYGRQIS